MTELASEDDADTYAFRLFSTAASATAAPSSNSNGPQKAATHDAPIARIKLSTPPPTDTFSSLAGVKSTYPTRPTSYYLASPPSDVQKAQFAASAIDGTEVMAKSTTPWFGWRMEWRVFEATVAAPQSSGVEEHDEQDADDGEAETKTKKRTRKGKKARIKLRIKFRAKEEAKKRKAEEEKEKEAYLAEKKRKLNRAKQIKKRAKAREEKALEKGQDGGGGIDVVETGDAGSGNA